MRVEVTRAAPFAAAAAPLAALAALERMLAAAAVLMLTACAEPPPPPDPLPPGLAAVAGEATQARVGDWPAPKRDAAGTAFSYLRDIDVENVADLELAWAYALDAADGTAPWGGSQGTPVYAQSKLFLAAGDRVVALDPDSGKELWRHVLERGTPARRGVAYWPGNEQAAARVLFTAGQRLLAVDAATGLPAAAFGEGGAVALEAPYDVTPVVLADAVILGAVGGVHAYDAATGAVLWRFATAESAFSVAVDVDRALVYAAFDALERAPEADDTVVALAARTGALVWRQRIPRGASAASGVPATPVLVDATIGDEARALLVQLSPHGFAHVLDRVTGEPLFEESSAENAAPLPIARVAYEPADLVTAQDTTAEHARLCSALVERYGDARVAFPGGSGSVGFGGAAADPRTGLVYVNTTSEGSLLVPAPGAADDAEPARFARVPFRAVLEAADPLAVVAPALDLRDVPELGWPCQKPPWGELVAVDVVHGTIAWRVPLGITAALPPGRERTGRPNAGGPIVTAGGLVFVAATDDRRLRAFDARDGEELWSVELPVAAHAVPMTYRGPSGRQYVAIVAAGPVAGEAGRPQVLAAYTLD